MLLPIGHGRRGSAQTRAPPCAQVDDVDVVHHLISIAADARANTQWQVALQCYTKALQQAQDIGAPKNILIDLYSRRGECNLEVTTAPRKGLAMRLTPTQSP